MNLLIQALIIFGISYVGDVIASVLPFPLPGSIIGLVLLFSALSFKIIKLKDIEGFGNWLKDHMAFFFVPLTVGIMVEFELLKEVYGDLIIVMFITTALTYLSVAKYVEWRENK